MRPHRLFGAVMLAWCALGVSYSAAAADQVVFVVRHAERADEGAGTAAKAMMGSDPPLSAAGYERAGRLAAMLAAAGVKHIFTTEYARTQQTAAPLAEAVKTKPSVVSSKDPAALPQQVRAAAGNVLVVGHSKTIPGLLMQLVVTAAIAIADNEYDNLFVVVRPATGEPTLIRLRY